MNDEKFHLATVKRAIEASGAKSAARETAAHLLDSLAGVLVRAPLVHCGANALRLVWDDDEQRTELRIDNDGDWTVRVAGADLRYLHKLVQYQNSRILTASAERLRQEKMAEAGGTDVATENHAPSSILQRAIKRRENEGRWRKFVAVNCALCGRELQRRAETVRTSATGLFFCTKQHAGAYRRGPNHVGLVRRNVVSRPPVGPE